MDFNTRDPIYGRFYDVLLETGEVVECWTDVDPAAPCDCVFRQKNPDTGKYVEIVSGVKWRMIRNEQKTTT